MFSLLLGEWFLWADWVRIIVHDIVDDVFHFFVAVFKQAVSVKSVI
jgi:hypothetical protein